VQGMSSLNSINKMIGLLILGHRSFIPVTLFYEETIED
jgi:hypothetical protein